ncbi:helix-turn-helix domain-containing protein [Candidatus Parcubacteria bacterium]|nr:helix-turn-helix domain-containing protein [Candidatus Parcubacteria bacterium]
MNDQEITKELRKFGLTDSQALIYVLLVRRSSLRVHEIAALTGIPRSSVYESLKVLFEYGLAEEIVQNNYKVIKPYPVSSLKHNLNEKILRIQQLTANLDALDRVLTDLPAVAAQPATTVRYYKGVSGARQLFWNTLKTRNMVYVYSEWGRGRYVGMKFYENFVRESRRRDIKEQVIVNPSERVLDSIRTYTGTKISRANIETLRCLRPKDILIRGETFIYDNVYAQAYLKGEEINAFEIESSQFTQTQRSIFETLWGMAEPVSRIL